MKKEVKDDSIKFIIQEDLIAPNIDKLKSVISSELDALEGKSQIVLDLNNISNIDSVGVSYLVSLYKRIMSEGYEFKIINASNDIVQLFKLMKLDDYLF